MEDLFSELFEYCSNWHSRRPISLPVVLMTKIENLSRKQRRELTSQTERGCAPLFMACQRGHVNIVKYLILKCDANIEQKGKITHEDEFLNYYGYLESESNVTPLWCATVSDHLEIVEFLFQHGADLNSVADNSGSTAVKKACSLNRMDLVSFFVRNGADILKPNYWGVTCLMVAVCHTEICELLLKNGARMGINVRDRGRYTALHYAIRSNQSQTSELLLAYGADPSLQCENGYDALATACLLQTPEIFENLRRSGTYAPERLANAYELLGAIFVLRVHFNYIQSEKRWKQRRSPLLNPWCIYRGGLDLNCWRKASEIRREAGVTKNINVPPGKIFEFTREFLDEEELERIFATEDVATLETQALLICERVLGSTHEDWISLLTARGRKFMPSQKSINLFLQALALKIQTDSLFSLDALDIIEELRYVFYTHARLPDPDPEPVENLNLIIDFEDPFVTLSLLFRRLSAVPKSPPRTETQWQTFDLILKEVIKLILILINLSPNPRQEMATRQLVFNLLRLNLRTSIKGNALLHLAVKMERHWSIFRGASVTSFLLSVGANVNVANNEGCSPLMRVAFKSLTMKSHRSYPVYQKLARILLAAGAHIDQVMSGQTLSERLGWREFINLTGLSHPHINLQCLAARAIRRYQIPYVGKVPVERESFVKIH